MKYCAFILSIFFLCSSLNLSAAVQNLFFDGSSCCAIEANAESCDSEEEEKNDCCNNGECECMCCATFIMTDVPHIDSKVTIHSQNEIASSYNFHLQENSFSIFHPPLFR